MKHNFVRGLQCLKSRGEANFSSVQFSSVQLSCKFSTAKHRSPFCNISKCSCQIFPPSPSPTESIRLFYTSVSLLLSRTQGYCYHLSKFHIYALVYCQSRFDARYWMLGAGALGRPRGMVWGGRREEGSGWGTHVYLWHIHFDIWQN